METKMNSCSDTNCILTEIGLSIKNAGSVGVCNQIKEDLLFEDGTPITLDKNSLSDAWNSPSRLKLRDDLNAGIKRSCCSDCWHEEAAGRDSKRQISNKIYSEIVPIQEQPRVLMIKPGNACNLGCRHCDLFASSNLVKDFFKVESERINIEDTKLHLKNMNKSFSKSNSVWETLKSWSNNILSLELYGGEPLLINSLWDVLSFASKSANAKNISIYINTNGTIWRDDYYDVFKSFKSVRLAISVDGIHEQFEYMRQPAKFDTFLSNLKKFDGLSLLNMSIETCITVSTLNIFYLPETIQYLSDLSKTHLNLVQKPGTNMLHYPLHLNLRNLPAEVKGIITQKLEVYETTLSDIPNVIQFLKLDMEDNEKHFEDFWRITKGYDALRNESYESSFKEMYNIMLPYLKNNC